MIKNIKNNGLFCGSDCCTQNIVLIALHSMNFSFIGESHGICTISGYLKSKYPDINIRIYDQQVFSVDEIISEIKNFKPSIIGISVKIQTYNQFENFHHLIQQSIPQTQKPIIVIGGSIPHFNSVEILNQYPDIIIGIGEGEISLIDIYQHIHGILNHDQIRNIAFKRGSQIIIRKQDYLSDLISLPDRSFSAKFFQDGGEVYIEGSRGCGYCNCSICECKDFLGSSNIAHKWRPHSLKLVINDLVKLIGLGIDNVTFSDEDFFGNDIEGHKRIIHLTKIIIDKQLNVKFRVNARVKSIYSSNDSCEIRDLKINSLYNLKMAGLAKVFIGFESGSKSQLKRYRKGFHLNEFINAISILDQLKIDYELGFIPVDPLMDLSELRESLDFIKKYNCITKVSSVFKELRIQSGNKIYKRQVMHVEDTLGIKIMGELDFNNQYYPILNYLDNRVSFIVEIMKSFSHSTYKLFYVIRILTQYSKESFSSDFNRQILFNESEALKKIEYDLFYNLIEQVEQIGINRLAAKKLLFHYECLKRDLFKTLLNNEKSSFTIDLFPYLKKEIVEYLFQNEFIVELH